MGKAPPWGFYDSVAAHHRHPRLIVRFMCMLTCVFRPACSVELLLHVCNSQVTGYCALRRLGWNDLGPKCSVKNIVGGCLVYGPCRAMLIYLWTTIK